MSHTSKFGVQALEQRDINPVISNFKLKDVKLVQMFLVEELAKMLNLSLTSEIIDSIDKVYLKGKINIEI